MMQETHKELLSKEEITLIIRAHDLEIVQISSLLIGKLLTLQNDLLLDEGSLNQHQDEITKVRKTIDEYNVSFEVWIAYVNLLISIHEGINKFYFYISLPSYDDNDFSNQSQYYCPIFHHLTERFVLLFQNNIPDQVCTQLSILSEKYTECFITPIFVLSKSENKINQQGKCLFYVFEELSDTLREVQDNSKNAVIVREWNSLNELYEVIKKINPTYKTVYDSIALCEEYIITEPELAFISTDSFLRKKIVEEKGFTISVLDAYCENSQDEEVKKDIWKYINNSDESVRYLKMHLRWSEERLQHIIKNRSSNDFYLYFQDLQTEKSVLNWEKDLKTQRGREAFLMMLDLMSQSIDIDLENSFDDREFVSLCICGNIKNVGGKEIIELNFRFAGNSEDEHELFAITIDVSGLYSFIEDWCDSEFYLEELFKRSTSGNNLILGQEYDYDEDTDIDEEDEDDDLL